MSSKLHTFVPILGLLVAAGFAGRFVQLAYAGQSTEPDPAIARLSDDVGFHLVAPTRIPPRTQVNVRQPAVIGKHRVLSPYVNQAGESVMIFAQEHRSAERDAVNRRYVDGHAFDRTEINGHAAGFSLGPMGQLRLAWFDDERFMVLMSPHFDAKALLQVAQSVR